MINKSEARGHLQNFVKFVQTQFGRTIQTIRTDNGSAFHMDSYFASHGIVHQSSCAYAPQQNGIMERKHQHILNVPRAL